MTNHGRSSMRYEGEERSTKHGGERTRWPALIRINKFKRARLSRPSRVTLLPPRDTPYQEQSLPAQAEVERPYFNSGVMVIDLEAWRMAEIEQCCLEAVRRLAHRTKWLDQHVLNACLAASCTTGRSGSASFQTVRRSL
jgi:Glycosyl transferase family 8